MRIKDVPTAPAYVVFHDAYMNGAMDVWPAESIEFATNKAAERQAELEAEGQEDCGTYRAYEKLPRVKVWKFHAPKVQA